MGSIRLNGGISKDGSLAAADNTRRKGDSFNKDEIERQLSHLDSTTRGIYNHEHYVEDRRYMMQIWADWLDKIRS